MGENGYPKCGGLPWIAWSCWDVGRDPEVKTSSEWCNFENCTGIKFATSKLLSHGVCWLCLLDMFFGDSIWRRWSATFPKVERKHYMSDLWSGMRANIYSFSCSCKLGATHLLQNCRVRVGWINFWVDIFLAFSFSDLMFGCFCCFCFCFFASLCFSCCSLFFSKSVDQSDLDQAYKTN